MPRSAALFFAVAAVIAAAAFAFHVFAPGAAAPPADAEGGDAATLVALRDLGERLDRMEQELFQPRLAPSDPAARLADLERRLQDLEHPPATEVATDAVATDEPGDAPPAPVSIQSLRDEDLLVKARSLASKQARNAAAPYWRELLDRNPPDELFVEAQIELGYAHRVGKDHEREEEAFREALRVAGPESERGQWATYQIAWSQHFRGDNTAARDTMMNVATARAAPRNLTGHARLYVAHFSLEMNDGERAREALQSILRDFGDSEAPADAWLARHATSMLAQLER